MVQQLEERHVLTPILPGVAMHLTLARTALTLLLAAVLAEDNPEAKRRLVAQFEPPRSIGTPIDDLARIFGGPGLADRIAGRLRLDTDGSLTPTARQLIRYRLAQGS
jgi:hypothetical protein